MFRLREFAALTLCVLLFVTSIGTNVWVHRCTRQDGTGCCHQRAESGCSHHRAKDCCRPVAMPNGEHKAHTRYRQHDCPLRADSGENCLGGCCQTTLVRYALDQLFWEKKGGQATRAVFPRSFGSLPIPFWRVADAGELFRAFFPSVEIPPPLSGRLFRILLCSFTC